MPAYPGGAPCGVHFLFAPDAHCGVAAWVDRQKQLPAASLSSRTSAGNQSRPASSPISWEPGVRSWKLPFKSKPREPLNETGLYDYAVKSLGRHMRTEAELRRLMQRRVDPGERGELVIAVVLARLKENGYLNDAAFAETYTRLRQ